MTEPAFDWTREEVEIIKGAWSTDVGRLALTLIVERLGVFHQSVFDESALRMAHGEGRRFVARQLMLAINLPLDKIVKDPDEPRRSSILTATERAERAGQPDITRSSIATARGLGKR